MGNLIVFVLGVIFASGLIGLGLIINNILKMNKKVKALEIDCGHNAATISEFDNNLRTRIDEVQLEMERRIDEVTSYIDSRYDKTSNSMKTATETSEHVLQRVLERVRRLESSIKITDMSENLSDNNKK
jgi:phage host-nuclease inhibitor protein Gam